MNAYKMASPLAEKRISLHFFKKYLLGRRAFSETCRGSSMNRNGVRRVEYDNPVPTIQSLIYDICTEYTDKISLENHQIA